MRDNYELAIVATKECLLVPYRRCHVERYHNWMQDPALLHATGSEPLTMEEEYEMQRSWRDDPNKCTFIVLCVSASENNESLPESDNSVPFMVGDVNLFLSELEDDEEPQVNNDLAPTPPVIEQRQAEIDIMIAEKSYHRQGLGRDAVCAMMMYGAKQLRIQRFFCKINETNQASLNLFRKLGFEQCDYAACFQQIELEIKSQSPDEMVERVVKLRETEELQILPWPLADCDEQMPINSS